jgi:hypothetical protein
VRCAADIQRELEAHNVDLPEDRRMRLRIGVNLGDVIGIGRMNSAVWPVISLCDRSVINGTFADVC